MGCEVRPEDYIVGCAAKPALEVARIADDAIGISNELSHADRGRTMASIFLFVEKSNSRFL